jgi:hypothetical protein
VARLAVVYPSILELSIVADAVKTGQAGHLAEPAADEDVLELVDRSRGKHLSESSGVELVLHLTLAIVAGLQGVVLESIVLGEGGEVHLLAPLVGNVEVTTAGRRGVAGLRAGSRRRSRSGGLGSRLVGRRLLGSRGGGRLLRNLVGRRRRRLDHDGGGRLNGRGLVSLRGLRSRRGGSSANGLAVRADDDGDDGRLPDDMGVAAAVGAAVAMAATVVRTGSSDS